MITEHIDWTLNRQWGELLSKSGTSMFVSAAPHSCRRIRKTPLDWQDTAVPRDLLIDGVTARLHWYGEKGPRVSYPETPVDPDHD